MSINAIVAENISKRYRIGLKEQMYDSLAGALVSWIKYPLSNYNRLRKLSKFDENGHAEDIIWALKDISFEVPEGEVLGIIGRNGAGKSTLLKILSRITDPTTGVIKIKNKISSLLEVGTGFHPELTGRENIYLNGTIIGMSKKEIDKKFDAIVDFSGVEKFIDTPIKRYSTGMKVRLAFAVAAHIEPEILIIDEVLAVGDIEFQKKCLGKMESVAKQGRTVLFVSHNMDTVLSLCNRTILLEDGKILLDGDTKSVIQEYREKFVSVQKHINIRDRTDREGSGIIKAVDFKILNGQGNPVKYLESGEDYIFDLQYENYSNQKLNNVAVSIDLYDERNVRVLLFRTSFTNSNIVLHENKGFVRCIVKDLPLANGHYTFSIYIIRAEVEVLDWIKDAYSIYVSGGDYFGTGNQGIPENCKILHRADWMTS